MIKHQGTHRSDRTVILNVVDSSSIPPKKDRWKNAQTSEILGSVYLPNGFETDAITTITFQFSAKHVCLCQRLKLLAEDTLYI